jgi:hypothetical protein
LPFLLSPTFLVRLIFYFFFFYFKKSFPKQKDRDIVCISIICQNTFHELPSPLPIIRPNYAHIPWGIWWEKESRCSKAI